MREVGSAYTTRPDSGCTLAVMAISGDNQNASGSDQACLLGQYHPPCSTISLSPAVHYNQPITRSALQSAYHPQCSTISLSPTVHYNQPIPSKHAGSDSYPVRIGREALARSRMDDSCTPACFRTGSVWPKPDTVSQN